MRKKSSDNKNPHNNNNNNNDKNIDSKNKLTTELSNTAAAKLLFGIFSAAADVLICFSVQAPLVYPPFITETSNVVLRQSERECLVKQFSLLSYEKFNENEKNFYNKLQTNNLLKYNIINILGVSILQLTRSFRGVCRQKR